MDGGNLWPKKQYIVPLIMRVPFPVFKELAMTGVLSVNFPLPVGSFVDVVDVMAHKSRKW